MNRWHKQMYDQSLASLTIGSKRFVKLAKKETKALIKILELKQGQEVLDVPCGTGRHASEFAKQGLRVTGLDISKDCIALAKKHCRSSSVKLSLANMNSLKKYRNKFDAVFNLFSSFGYFDTETKNEQVLRELISTLRPGGKIAIHLINRDWLLKVFRPVEWREKGETFILDARKYDKNTHCIEAQTAVINRRTNKGKTYYHRMRLYSKPEMTDLMHRCGLVDIKVLGNFEGEKFSKFRSSHPIYIARKPFNL